MDLNDLIDEQEAWLDVMKPDGGAVIGADGEPWRIKLAGPTHPRGFKAEEAIRLRMLKAYEDAEENKSNDRETDYINRVLEPLVIRTLDWTPINFNGQPFPCNATNARALYQQSDLVRKQVEGFVVRATGFRKPPSQNSATTHDGTLNFHGSGKMDARPANTSPGSGSAEAA